MPSTKPSQFTQPPHITTRAWTLQSVQVVIMRTKEWAFRAANCKRVKDGYETVTAFSAPANWRTSSSNPQSTAFRTGTLAQPG